MLWMPPSPSGILVECRRSVHFVLDLYIPLRSAHIMKKGGEPMDTGELKKFLAGFGIVGLLAGAGLILGGSLNKAEAS